MPDSIPANINTETINIFPQKESTPTKTTPAVNIFAKAIKEKRDEILNKATPPKATSISYPPKKTPAGKAQKAAQGIVTPSQPSARERVSGAAAHFPGLRNQRIEMEKAIASTGKEEKEIVKDLVAEKRAALKKKDAQGDTPISKFQIKRFEISGEEYDAERPDMQKFVDALESSVEERFETALKMIEQDKMPNQLGESRLYSFEMSPEELAVFPKYDDDGNEVKTENVMVAVTPFINEQGKPDLDIRVTVGYIRSGTFTSVYTSADVNTASTQALKITKLPPLPENVDPTSHDGKVLKTLAQYDSADRETHFLSDMAKTAAAVKTRDAFYTTIKETSPETGKQVETPVFATVQEQFLDEVSLFVGEDEAVVNDVVSQMLNEVKLMHEKDIINRDIKPENFLFRETPEGDYQVGIIDGGGAALKENTRDIKTGLHGTEPYMSPEQIKNFLIQHQYLDADMQETGKASDIYSLAMTMHYVMFGDYPKGTEAWIKVCEKGVGNCSKATILAAYNSLASLPEPPKSDARRHLIWEMMQPDPKMRPTIEQAQKRFNAMT